MSSSRPMLCVCVCQSEPTEFGTERSEFPQNETSFCRQNQPVNEEKIGEAFAGELRSGQSTVGSPKWTKIDLFGPK